MIDPQPPPNKQDIPLNRVLGLTTDHLLVAGIMIGSGAFEEDRPHVAGFHERTGYHYGLGCSRHHHDAGRFYLCRARRPYRRVRRNLRIPAARFWRLPGIPFWLDDFYDWRSGAIAALAFVFSQSFNTLFQLPDPFIAWKDFSIGGLIYPFASSGIKIFAVMIIPIDMGELQGCQKWQRFKQCGHRRKNRWHNHPHLSRFLSAGPAYKDVSVSVSTYIRVFSPCSVHFSGPY